MAEEKDISSYHDDKGKWIKGHPGYPHRNMGGRKETAEAYIKEHYSKLLPDTVHVLKELMLNSDIPPNVRVAAVKVLLEYTVGKPQQTLTLATTSEDTSPTELTRLDMKARLDALDPVIIELEAEMEQAQEYQDFLTSKAKKGKKEKVINE